MSKGQHITILLLLAVLVCLPGIGTSYGDVVMLESNESLSGTFSRIRDNTLVFRTSLSGQMMTPMAEVRSLSVKAPLYITMTDGHVYYGRLGVEDGQQTVIPLDGGAPVPIETHSIQETLPIPTPPTVAPQEEGTDWEIGFTPGLHWRSDRDATLEPSIRIDAVGDVGAWRFRGDAWTERSDPDDFPTFLRASGLFEHGGDKPSRPFVSVGVERDLDRALEWRQELTLGFYRNLYGRDADTLDAAIGLGYEHERRRAPAGSAVMRDDALQLRLGLRYYRLFARRHSLSESLTFYPAVTNMGAYRARSETTYALPLSDRLRLRLDVVIDYESDPLFGGLNRWSGSVGAGVNIAF